MKNSLTTASSLGSKRMKKETEMILSKLRQSFLTSEDKKSLLHSINSENYNKITDETLPTNKNESFKYFPIKKTLEHLKDSLLLEKNTEFSTRSQQLLVDKSQFSLLFINGQLSSSFPMPKGLSILAIDKIKDKELVCKKTSTEDDFFSQLNSAHMRNGCVIKVEDNTQIDKPINLIYLNLPNSNKSSLFIRNYIKLGANSKCTIYENYLSTQKKEASQTYFINTQSDIHLLEGASLTHTRLEADAANSQHIGCTRVIQEKDSRLKSLSFSQGASISRQTSSIELNGTGASVELDGLYLGSKRKIQDHYTHINHNASYTKSSQLYKGGIGAEAKGSYLGAICVAKNLKKISAHQLSRSLLLSNKADAKSRPQLQIDSDDVKCNHGATISQLNNTELLYLRSRGINEKKATKMLTLAFIDELSKKHQLKMGPLA